MSAADTPEPAPKEGTGDVWAEVIHACVDWWPGFSGLEWEAYWLWVIFGSMPVEEAVKTEQMPAGLQHDMWARRDFGLAKYGRPLQRGNARNHYADAYQEALDLVAYTWAARGPWWLRWGAVLFAWAIRRRLP